MILFLLQYLHEILHFKIWPVFFYSSTRMILAAITTLCMTIFLGPFFIRLLEKLKFRQTIRENKKHYDQLAKLHSKKKDTPTMGGLFILFSMICALLLWMDLSSIFTWILLVTAIFLATVGFIDDYLKLKHKNSKGISAKLKFILQAILAIVICSYLLFPSFSFFMQEKMHFTPPVAKEQKIKKIDHKPMVIVKTLNTKNYISRLYVPFFKKPIVVTSNIGWVLLFLFLVFVIIGSSNAVNLTDGLDGLASGLLIMVSFVLAFFAFLSNHIELSRYLNILYIEGSGEIAVFLFALCGAALGFLWYNGYPAQVFLGDTGSLALGGIIAVAAILLRREILLAIIGGVFVMEALSVILQVLSYRYRKKKRIFLCSPLHHHFEYKGWAETKVVLRFWIIGLLLAIIGIASLKFQ